MYFREAFIFKSYKIPEELTINEDIINGSASGFKKACEAQLKYMKENEFPEKQIAKAVYWYYYGVLGTTFGTKINKYNPKMGVVIDFANQYCDSKQRSLIKKDIEKTIKALQKMIDDGKTLTNIQSEYLKDIEKAVIKIKE